MRQTGLKNAMAVCAVAGLAWAADSLAQETKPRTFGEDVAFMQKHTQVVVLARGDAKVALAPAYHGRVMTSTTRGDGGPSFGWLNDKLVAAGVQKKEARLGKLEDHIHVFGGEERFWMGPEGGQFSIFFAPGAKFVFDDWHTPPFIDTDPFKLTRSSPTSATFETRVQTENYSRTRFDIGIQRTVSLLDGEAVGKMVGAALPAGVRFVAYETDNRITNRGDKAWTKETGLLSIWLLGMYKPSPETTIVIPFQPGAEDKLGPKVNDAYFGKVPADRLIVKDNVLFFKGDGAHRSKIGLTPQRSKGIAGSFDARQQMLTLVTYNVPAQHEGYVNSMWELQKDPFSGDVLNSYNDGPPGPNLPPLGPFYELETSSPAAALKPGETLQHIQRTLHLEGPEPSLDGLTRQTLGVSLADIKGAFKK
jgi:hypothetical protein